MVHSTGEMSTESAERSYLERRKTKNLNGQNTVKYYRPNPELAGRYLEEKAAAMSL